MEPYQELRVINEKKELDMRLGRLEVFNVGETFKGLSVIEQGRLKRQYSIMTEYSAVLGLRIKAFGE